MNMWKKTEKNGLELISTWRKIRAKRRKAVQNSCFLLTRPCSPNCKFIRQVGIRRY